jgi:catabolite regulation protein CreA
MRGFGERWPKATCEWMVMLTQSLSVSQQEMSQQEISQQEMSHEEERYSREVFTHGNSQVVPSRSITRVYSRRD